MASAKTLFPSSMLNFIFFLIAVAPCLCVSQRKPEKKCLLMNFGDSNSDTGMVLAQTGVPWSGPYGVNFNKRGDRLSDGRLYIDYLCENLNISYLSPYLESVGSDFTHGINFARAAATATSDMLHQVSIFIHVLNQTQMLKAQGKEFVISEKEFQQALYSVDLGQNDISNFFGYGKTYEEIVSNKIPISLATIKQGVEDLYRLGARKFLIYNTGPLGCLSKFIVEAKPVYKDDLDKVGCLSAYNDAAKVFNKGLKVLCEKLGSQMNGIVVVYIDMYAIKYDLFTSPQRYGFEHPLMTCCGSGGPPYNYESRHACDAPNSTATACQDPFRIVNWDGIHLSQAANSVIAAKIISGNYSNPAGIKLKDLCAS